jgi:hypothetical protein
VEILLGQIAAGCFAICLFFYGVGAHAETLDEELSFECQVDEFATSGMILRRSSEKGPPRRKNTGKPGDFPNFRAALHRLDEARTNAFRAARGARPRTPETYLL